MAYPSVYPTSLDSYTTKTDNVDNVMAVDVNELQSAIVAIETLLGTGGGLTITNATNPSIRCTDTTTPCTIKMQALDTSTIIGNTTNHSLLIVTNNATRATVGASGGFTFDNVNVGTASGATGGQVRAQGAGMFSGVTGHSYSQQVIASLADHGKEQLGLIAGEEAFAFIICQNTGTLAIYTLQGGIHVAQEVADPSSKYTVTEDNDTTTNIYWDAGNARYELNNELGSTVTYLVWLLRYAP